jgi:hypothetical protein
MNSLFIGNSIIIGGHGETGIDRVNRLIFAHLSSLYNALLHRMHQNIAQGLVPPG